MRRVGAVLAEDPGIRSRVVILTAFEHDDYVFDALPAGASGFLLKSAPPAQLGEAGRPAAAGPPAPGRGGPPRCSPPPCPGASSRPMPAAARGGPATAASSCSQNAS